MRWVAAAMAGPTPVGGVEKGGPEALGGGREGQARGDVVRLYVPMLPGDPLDVLGRAQDGDEAGIVDGLLEVVDEVGIGVDRDQHPVGRQLLQDRPAEGADAR